MDAWCLLGGWRKDEEGANLEGSEGELDLRIGEIERGAFIEDILKDVAFDDTRDSKAKANRGTRRASKRFVQTDDESIGEIFGSLEGLENDGRMVDGDKREVEADGTVERRRRRGRGGAAETRRRGAIDDLEGIVEEKGPLRHVCLLQRSAVWHQRVFESMRSNVCCVIGIFGSPQQRE